MKRLAAEGVVNLSMPRLCGLFGKSFQAYYQHRDTLAFQRLREEIVLQFVAEIRQQDPGLGSEKLQLIYKRRFGADYEYMVDATRWAKSSQSMV